MSWRPGGEQQAGMLTCLLLLLLALVTSASPFTGYEDPCTEAREVPYHKFAEIGKSLGDSRPWTRKDLNPKLHASDTVRYQWNWIESLPVRGMSSVTVGHVLSFLADNNCYFIAWGDVVWKTVRMLQTTAIEGEVTCDLTKLQRECFAKYGWASECSLRRNGKLTYLQIGAHDGIAHKDLVAEPIIVYAAGSRWNVPLEQLGWSVDSMGIYDTGAGEVYLVDLTGHGYVDICERRLVPAVDKNHWKEWSRGQGDKLMRYFELRGQGFKPGEEDVKKVIEKGLKEASFSDTEVRRWYCEGRVLHGVIDDDDGGDKCQLVAPSNETQRVLKAEREALQDDIPNLWANQLSPALAHMEEVYLTENAMALRTPAPMLVSDRAKSYGPVTHNEGRPLPLDDDENGINSGEDGETKPKPVQSANLVNDYSQRAVPDEDSRADSGSAPYAYLVRYAFPILVLAII